MITNILTNSIAENIKSLVNNVLINSSILVSSFILNEVTNNIYEFKFNVISEGLTLITNIKIRDASNQILIEDTVSISTFADGSVIRYVLTIS